MSDPTIPPLALANDHSQVGIDNDDTYGLHFEIDARENWVYTPECRFPKYDAQILVSILIGTDEGALCASQSAADAIVFLERTGQSVSSGTYSSQNSSYSWMVTITAGSGDVIIGKKTPLMIDVNNITPNDVAGNAGITLLPRLKAKHTGTADIDGIQLSYTVEKTSPPIVIDSVVWSGGAKPGPGNLTWEVTGGGLQGCTLRANGEEIGKNPYHSNNSQYEANLTLEMGTHYVTITAEDKNHNTATYRELFNFDNFNPYFILQVTNGLPLSLVRSDRQDCLYGVFSNPKDGTQVWKNTNSATQDNWRKTGLIVKSGYETSPCVYYHSQFYLLGGSLFGFGNFQNHFWTFREDDWYAIPAPDGWMNEPRIGQSVALFDQAIWVAGGYGASGTVYNDVYSYDGNGGWKQQANLPQALCNASLAAVGSKLYLFGGYSDMPGGSTSTTLYCLADDSRAWVAQITKPPPGPADYWALGSVGGELLLLGNFGGSAFTGTFSGAAYWQGGDESFSDVARCLRKSSPPYGFTTCAYVGRLFLIIATSEGPSVFAYYEPAMASKKGAGRP